MLAFGAGVAVAALAQTRTASSSPKAARPPGRGAPAAADAGPARVTKGIPSGFARSCDGAAAAAAAFVCTGQALLDLDPLSVEEAVRSMAASASADRQVADTTTQLHRTRDALASGRGPIIFRQAVVAYRVDAFDAQRARVAVWNVGVLTRDGVAPPQAGPAPVLNDSTAPATSAQLVQSLDGFVDFGAHP